MTVVKFLRFRKSLWETTNVYLNEGERQIVERGKKRKKNARGVALLVVGGIAARALWSYMVKRSDAEDRKMEDGEKNIASEVAAERKAASSAKLRQAQTTYDDPCSAVSTPDRDQKPY